MINTEELWLFRNMIEDHKKTFSKVRIDSNNDVITINTKGRREKAFSSVKLKRIQSKFNNSSIIKIIHFGYDMDGEKIYKEATKEFPTKEVDELFSIAAAESK